MVQGARCTPRISHILDINRHVVDWVFTGRPLFPGSTNEDELLRIFRLMGTPTEQTWPGIAQYSEYKATWPYYVTQNLSQILPMMDNLAIDLLQRLLVMQPNLRISAKDALRHPYFSY